MTALRRGVTAGALLLFLGGAAAAQETSAGPARLQDSPRAGFWGALGFGAGGEAFDLRDGLGYSEDLYRPTVSLRLGGTPGKYLRLGGEVLG